MWEQGTKHLVALGCRQYVEAGPGKQLKAMMGPRLTLTPTPTPTLTLTLTLTLASTVVALLGDASAAEPLAPRLSQGDELVLSAAACYATGQV